MLPLNRFDYKKAVAAISFLTKREGGNIDKLKLVKLLYFADRYHVRKYGRPISNDVYFAMKMGPAPSGALDIIKPNEMAVGSDAIKYAKVYLSGLDGAGFKGDISIREDPDLDVLSESDIEALEKVSETFKGFASKDMVKLTHKYPEWIRHRAALNEGSTACVPMSYADFFIDVSPATPGASLFIDEPERLQAAQQDFAEHKQVANFWG